MVATFKDNWKGLVFILLAVLFAWIAFCIAAQQASALNLIGTSGPDSMYGTDSADYVDLKGGSDAAHTYAGDDYGTLDGGDDWVWGGNGRDQFEGNDGDDVIYLEGGQNNQGWGNDGNDYVTASNGYFTDNLFGGEGDNDTCRGDWDDSSGAHDDMHDCEVRVWVHRP